MEPLWRTQVYLFTGKVNGKINRDRSTKNDITGTFTHTITW